MAKPNRLPELFDELLEEISNGKSVFKVCRERNLSRDAFYNYIESEETLKDRYIKAREERGDRCLDKIEEYQTSLINGLIDAATARVLIDTEKWKACKFYPKMYGDKQEITHSGSVNLMPTVKINGKDLDIKVGEDV